MLEELKDWAVGVAQVAAAEDARGVQIIEVSEVSCVFRDILQRGEVGMKHPQTTLPNRC